MLTDIEFRLILPKNTGTHQYSLNDRILQTRKSFLRKNELSEYVVEKCDWEEVETIDEEVS